MTDFIHEKPKEDAEAEKKEDIYSAPADSKTRAKRVFVYALALFAVAFLLLLWSFLINDGSNREVLSRLSNLQSSVEDDNALNSRILRLEEKLEDAEQKSKELQALTEQNTQAISAIDRLRVMQAAFERGDTGLAKKAAFELVDNQLVDLLPETSVHTFCGNDQESPRAAYDRMHTALFPNGMDKEFADWQKNR